MGVRERLKETRRPCPVVGSSGESAVGLDSRSWVRAVARSGECAVCLLAGSAVAISVLFVLVRMVASEGPVDDAFIVFRYAENLARGNGPVFNVGEPVEGVTSPAWLWLLAAGFRLGSPPETSAGWLGVASGLLCIFSLLFLFVRLSGTKHVVLGLAAAAGLAGFPAFAGWSGAGLETPLTALALLTSAAGLLRILEGNERLAVSGVSLTLFALVRPEGAAFLAGGIGLAGYRFARGRLRFTQLVEVVIPSLAFVAFLAWRIGYYGDVVPNTAHAKLGASSWVLATRGARYVGGFLLTYQWLAWAAVVLLAFIATREHREKLRIAVLSGAAAAWMLIVLVAGGDHFPFHRYLVPSIPVILLTLALAGSVLAKSLRFRAGQTLALATVLLVALLASSWAGARRAGGDLVEEAALAVGWGEVGKWTKSELEPSARIAAFAIGALGYESGLYLVDMLGLTDSRIAREGEVVAGARAGHDRFLGTHVINLRPDLIVLPGSGQVFPDRGRNPLVDAERYGAGLARFVADPLTHASYVYREFELPSGKAVQVLQRRDVRLKSAQPVWEWTPPGRSVTD